MDEVIDWLRFYNHRRLHTTLGYLSPMQFEWSWSAAQHQRCGMMLALAIGYEIRGHAQF